MQFNSKKTEGTKIIPYTTKEKVLLASLVNNYNIVENKKTDAATIQMRTKGWEMITRDYNAQGDVISLPRSAAQLKKLWNNIKQRKRKATTELKYERLRTGGGSEPEVEEDPVMNAVDLAAPHLDVTIENPWDSTANYKSASASASFPSCSYSSDGGAVMSTVKNSVVAPLSSFNLLPNSKRPTTPARAATADEIIDDPGSMEDVPSLPSRNPVTEASSFPRSSNPVEASVLFSPRSKPAKKAVAIVEKEASLRVQKMRAMMEQQQEHHNIKMQIENEQLRQLVS